MFTPVAINETWGDTAVSAALEPRENFADAKASVVSAVDMQVRVCLAHGHPHEVATLPPSVRLPYAVGVAWRPEGDDGIVLSFVFAVEVN